MNLRGKCILASAIFALVSCGPINSIVQASANAEQKRAVTTTLRLPIFKEISHSKTKDNVSFSGIEANFTVLLDEGGKKTAGIHCSLVGTGSGSKSGRKFQFVGSGHLTLDKNAPSMREVSIPCHSRLLSSSPNDEQGLLVIVNLSLNPSGKIIRAEVRNISTTGP